MKKTAKTAELDELIVIHQQIAKARIVFDVTRRCTGGLGDPNLAMLEAYIKAFDHGLVTLDQMDYWLRKVGL